MGQAFQHHWIRVGKHKINGHGHRPPKGFGQTKSSSQTGEKILLSVAFRIGRDAFLCDPLNCGVTLGLNQ
jgi:hypothetical protein